MLRDLRSIILMALCCVTFGFCTQVFAGRGDILLTLESPMQGDPVWGLTCDGTHLWGYGDSRRLLYKMTFNGDVISTRTVTRSMYGMDWHEGALWYSSPAGENSEIRRLNLSGEETTAFLFRDENGDPPRTSWGYYANPYGVAWENDNVWVSPGHNEHLYRYDIATTTTRAVGSMTLPFHMPWGVAWGNGSLWVINTGTPFKIYEFSTAGEVRSIMPYPFEWPAATPVDLAWDGISLWCSDPARHEIIRLTTDGRVLSSFRTPLRQVSPKGLAFDGATLWITHRENYPDSELMRVTTSGSVVDSFPIDTNNYADDMAWDGTRLLMADSNFRLIRVYDTQGKQTQSLAPSRWTTQDKVFRPYGVAFDGARVLVSLLEVFSYTWSVETMTASGDMVSSFPLPASPWPLAIAWDGVNVVVSDNRNGTLGVFNPSTGAQIESFSSPADISEGLDFDGQALWQTSRDDRKIYQLEYKSGVTAIRAVDDTATVRRDSADNGIDVLKNDPVSDVTIFSVSNGKHGTATTGIGQKSVRYTPNPGFQGTDRFYYAIRDAAQTTASALVVVTVEGDNNPPVAHDDQFRIIFNSPAVELDVLANDTTEPGETLSIISITKPIKGKAAIIRQGRALTYEPLAGYKGNDTFSYTISDGNGGEDIAHVNLIVGNDLHGILLR